MYNNMQGQGWGRPPQQQGGFQQPQMTGYQQQPQQGGYLNPQQTGYPGMSQFQRPMQTGFPQQQQGLAPQQTGMMGMGMQNNMLGPGGSGQMRPQGGSQFLTPSSTGMGMGMGGGLQPQPTGYMGGGLQPQQTGYMGGGLQMQQTGLMPQMTGMPIRDPRLQLMSAQFLPASQPFSGAQTAGNMNFNQASMQPSNFQSQIQNLSQQQQGSKEPRIPWALSKEERKSYDSIFRAWDASGSGFINGEVAHEVFGQSGLDRERLMQIWHLADTENRGKLNINEFHVAMGLIYRVLNGNDVPDVLPAELIPPSARDLNDSVDFLKDLLKKDTTVRNSTGLNLPEAGSNSNANYAKARSFHQNPIAKKDATAYKHDDTDVSGYKSSSRHLDRKTVRYEGQSATDDLSEMKRQLENTQKMLDKHNTDDDEDRELDREMDDLRYRIRRVQDDIDYYNRRGGRDSQDLRRKSERELMHLMHERLPTLEKRVEARDSRMRDRKLGESRERDRRNDPYNRYGSKSDDRDQGSRSSTTLGDGEYLRGTFDRERDDDRRRDNGRYDDRREGDRSSSAAPTPPPAASPRPAAPSPAPTASSGPPKNLSPEERAAWIRSEAQRRVQERMRMLGAVAPSSPSVDNTVEERLKAEQAEAAAKSAQADQETAAREEARKARLEEQRLQTEKSGLATVKQEIKEAEKGSNPPPAPVVQAAKEEINDQEDMIRRREEVLAKEKAEREARLRKLEEQEEEARKQEEAFKERQSMFNNQPKSSPALPAPSRKSGKPAGGPPPPPPSRSRAAPPPAAAQAPAAPPAPPAVQSPPQSTPTGGSSTNPFHRMQQGAPTSPAAPPAPALPGATASTPGGTNPFYRPQPAQADSNLPAPSRSTPPVSAQPTGQKTPSSASRALHVAPKHDDDDWGESDKEEDDEEADGPGSSTRATRQNLAQALFSNLIPSSGRSTPPASPAPPAAPAAPAAPPAPAAPSAPAAPPAPVAPKIQPAAGPVDRGALLGAIQGGAKLKKAQTHDRSKALVTGTVIGDPSPPVRTYVPPPSPPAAPEAPVSTSAVAERSVEDAAVPPSPPPPPAPPAPSMPGAFDGGDASFAQGNPNRQSVDWANSLANDHASTNAAFVPDEPSVREVDEGDSSDDDVGPEDPEALHVTAPNGHAKADDALSDFDLSRTVRVRTLYGYAGQRDEDLTFEENDILDAHAPKDASSDWWYGSLKAGSKKGYFPRSYVEPIEKTVRAKALYAYTGTSPEEATFSEGDELLVVDQDDANWWRVDVGGSKVLIAPATYLEISGIEHPGSQGRHERQQPSDSDAESGVLVRMMSQDSTRDGNTMSRPLTSGATGPGDWIVVDENRSLGSSMASVRPEDQDASMDEEARLSAAVRESQLEHTRQQELSVQEDKELQAALEASKMEAVAYALGSVGDAKAGSVQLGGSETEDADSDSTTGWTSSEDEDDDDDQQDETQAPATDEEIRKEAVERLRVLEAAGVLVKTDDADSDATRSAGPSGAAAVNDYGANDDSAAANTSRSNRRPPPPPGQKRHKNVDELMMLSRSRTTRKPPARPDDSQTQQRRKPPHRPKKKPSRELPPPPIEKPEAGAGEERMEDAYDRYLKLTKEVSLQPILPATAPGAKPAAVAAPSPTVAVSSAALTSPGLAGSSSNDSSVKGSGFLSTIKSMSNRSAWSGVGAPVSRPDSGIGHRLVSAPIQGGMPSIPGPQTGSDSAHNTSDTPATPFRESATSWSSLVDRDLLSSLSDTERKRQESIFELISTEIAHVRDLQIVVEVFFNSMQSLLSEKASTVIFANVESVLFAAVTLLSDLEARQKQDRLYVSSIGDILDEHMSDMNVYLPYCVNQQTAREILEAERKRDSRIDIHLLNIRAKHPAARGLDLSHFLLVPMQRLTRYPLLLGQILRYTPEDHVDYAMLQNAKKTAEGILAKTNEAIRDHQESDALAKLSQNLWIGEEAKLDLTKPFTAPDSSVRQKRSILRDELVTKSKSGRKLRLVLTTDLLLVLHAQDASLYRMPMPVNAVAAKETKSRHADTFNVSYAQEDTLKLRANSPRSAQAWIKAIDAARSGHK